MTSYQPGIPTGTVDLDQDYLNIQGNFQQLDTTYGTDHVAYSVSLNNGYHKAIHFVPQAPPTAVTGIGEIYTQTTNDGISTGQQLFYQFINGSAVTINTALTRNFQPLASQNGYTFLPGGFIMQWFVVGSPVTGTPYAYPIPFPNTCWNVSLTQIVTNNSTFRLNVLNGTVNNTNFEIQATAGLPAMYVTAIGN